MQIIKCGKKGIMGAALTGDFGVQGSRTEQNSGKTCEIRCGEMSGAGLEGQNGSAGVTAR